MTKETENQNKKGKPTVNPLLIAIAEKLRITELEGTTPELISIISERVTLIEERLTPLVEFLNSDGRAQKMFDMAIKGSSVDDIIPVISNLNQEEGNANYEGAVVAADTFCRCHNLENEGIETFIAFIETNLRHISKGEITVELLETLWRSYNYDTDLQEAYDAGVVAGKNKRISAAREERADAEALGSVTVGKNINSASQKQGYIEKLLQSK